MATENKGYNSPLIEYSLGGSRYSTERDEIAQLDYVSSILSRSNMHRATIPGFSEVLDSKGKITFKFGWTGGNLSAAHQAWLYGSDYFFDSPDVPDAIITGSDYSLNINRGEKNRGFTKKKISDIVRQIASDNGLEAVVEDTVGVYTVRQIWLSDVAFIKKVLLPKAVSAKNKRADYDVYIDYKGRLHFHTPDYQNQIYKKYVIGTVDVREFRLTFHGEISNALGGLETRMHGYDPFEKEVLKFVANDASTKEKELLGEKTTMLDLPRGATTGRYYHEVDETKQEVENSARARWYRAHRIRYTGVLKILGDPNLEAGEVVSVIVPLPNGEYHHSSGRYLVQVAHHMVTRGKGYFTTLYLARNGLLEGDTTLKGTKRKGILERAKGAIIKEAKRQLLGPFARLFE